MLKKGYPATPIRTCAICGEELQDDEDYLHWQERKMTPREQTAWAMLEWPDG